MKWIPISAQAWHKILLRSAFVLPFLMMAFTLAASLASPLSAQQMQQDYRQFQKLKYWRGTCTPLRKCLNATRTARAFPA